MGILVHPEDFSKLGRNDHAPEEESRVPGTIIGRAFLGRTVRLEVKLGNGKQVNLALPNHQTPAGGLNPGRPVVLANGSCQASPSNARFGPQIMGPDDDAWATLEA